MDIEFSCDKCRSPLVLDAAGAGQVVNCPKCGSSRTAPTAASPLISPPPPVRCQAGHHIKLGRADQGDPIRCPNCGRLLPERTRAEWRRGERMEAKSWFNY